MLNHNITRPNKKDFGKKLADAQRGGKPAKTRKQKGRV